MQQDPEQGGDTLELPHPRVSYRPAHCFVSIRRASSKQQHVCATKNACLHLLSTRIKMAAAPFSHSKSRTKFIFWSSLTGNLAGREF